MTDNKKLNNFNNQLANSKGYKIFIRVLIGLIVGIAIIIGTLSEDEKNTSEKEIKVEKVFNSELDGSVYQVEKFLKNGNYLKDPESYEPINWWNVFKNDKQFIEYRKTIKPYIVGEIECIKGEPLAVISKKGNNYHCVRLAYFDSLYFDIDSSLTRLSEIQPDNSYTYSVVHEFRSKNSFGGYVVNKLTFFLDENGEVVNIK